MELMDSLCNTEELKVFDTPVVKDYFEFHWESYAKHVHYLGAINHSIYLIMTTIYVNEVYNYRDYTNRIPYLWVMFTLLFYPMIYDNLQLKN
jgi:hypothetical protein